MEEDRIEQYIKNAMDDDTRKLISNFAVLWNQYENKLYDKEYYFSKVRNIVKEKVCPFEQKKQKMLLLCDRLRHYIKKRGYEFTPDIIAEKFFVRIRENNEPRTDIKRTVLTKIMFSNKDEDKIQFLLLIIGRVRNNMFHGLKGIWDLKYQKELFQICNETLWYMVDQNL